MSLNVARHDKGKSRSAQVGNPLGEGLGSGARTNGNRTLTPTPPPYIVGMRNRLIHDYFRLDLRKIWDTAQQDVPKLIALLEPIVPPETS